MKVGIGRKAIELEVNEELFTIKFVSVFARKRASDLFSMVDKITKINDLPDEEKVKAMSDLEEVELNNILESRTECIENLLTSNGYKFDPDWWDKNTGYEEQNEFIYVCLAKDITKKKVIPKQSEK